MLYLNDIARQGRKVMVQLISTDRFVPPAQDAIVRFRKLVCFFAPGNNLFAATEKPSSQFAPMGQPFIPCNELLLMAIQATKQIFGKMQLYKGLMKKKSLQV